MNLEEYYKAETRTLILPFEFNEELKGFPSDVKIIIFEENLKKKEFSNFDQLVGHLDCNTNTCPCNLPNNLTHLTFGYCFNRPVNKLPRALALRGCFAVQKV